MTDLQRRLARLEAAQGNAEAITDPDSDLKQARVTLAGWGAEFLFEPLRLASSLDECVLAGHMCKWAASKLGRPPEDVLDEQIGLVLDTLKEHERYVRRIAAALTRHTILRGAQLATLLPEARGAS